MLLSAEVSSSVSTTEYTSFDILGRVTGHKQTTDGEDYETEYAYNLSGALVEQTYPSGRKVKNVIDNNGYLSMVQSRKSPNHGYWNYVQNFTYNAGGAVNSMQLGNGRWESTQFNSRLQPTQIALGVTPGATNLLKLDYTYGTTENNGNVLSQTITVPTVGQTDGFVATQSYEYDTLTV
jgi:YD repeat-containing protein